MAYSRSSNTSNSALLSDQIGMVTNARPKSAVDFDTRELWEAGV